MSLIRIDQDRLRKGIEDSVSIIGSLASMLDSISSATEAVIGTLKAGGKVLTAGNGGSAAEALHMAEELVGRFRSDRASLPAVSLVADSTALTCIGNDYGFDMVFSRQVEGLGRPGDVLVLFSTSGNARNLALASDAARSRGVKVVCILGRDGGPLAGKGDVDVIVAGRSTERIQEAHQVIVHLILDAVEATFV